MFKIKALFLIGLLMADLMQANGSTKIVQRIIEVGGIYRHYSGKMYKIVAIANDSEDPSLKRVVYQGLYTCPTFGKNPIWVRPEIMFAESIVVNGLLQERFALVKSMQIKDDVK